MPERTDTRPPPLTSELSVNDLSAVGDEVWAVGSDRFPGPALIAHTAGGERWQLTSYSGSSDAHHTTLRGVHATTSDDVWAVGSVGLPHRTHIIHGDGRTWQQAERPDGADGESLADVAAWGRDDAFAVGSRRPPPPSPLADLAGWDTLAVRWDGARWAAVPGLGHGLLSDVCAVGPGAYWTVGTARIATRAGNLALVAHYADEHWQESGSEVPGSLSGVAATGPDDVWAVGRDQDPSHPPGPLILHYDGHAWAPADVPEIAGQAWLEAVACAGRDNVWAVGGKERDDGFSGPFILNFDGSAWAAVEPPAFGAPTGELEAVTALPGGAAWAAGNASPWPVFTGFSLPLVPQEH